MDLKGPVILVTVLGLPAGSLLSSISNTSGSVADAAVLYNEATDTLTEACYPDCAIAVITITMTPVSSFDERG